jgi:urease accessory protein
MERTGKEDTSMEQTGRGIGTTSELRTAFRRGAAGRTVLKDAYFTSPLKLTKTFPVEGPSLGTAVTVMDVSPGLMDGDRYTLDWDIGKGCSVSMTTQSYAKVHPCPRIGARQTTTITVGEGASLIYAPQPMMLYADASFTGTVRVELAENASLLLYDTLCAGRVHFGEGEAFRYRLYENDLLVSVQGRLALANRMRLEPLEQTLPAIGIFERFTHLGTLYAFGPYVNRSTVEALRHAAEALPGVRVGVSLAARYGLTATAIGMSAWTVHEALLAMGHVFTAFAAEQSAPACMPFACGQA